MGQGNHTRGTDCKDNPVGKNPENAAQIMGRLALASKILKRGDWPKMMQSMQWGNVPRSNSNDENKDFALSTRGTYLQCIKLRYLWRILEGCLTSKAVVNNL